MTTTPALGSMVETVKTLVGGGDGGAQLRQAGQRRILVALVEQRGGGGLHHVRWAVSVGKALAEIDRAVLLRQGRHDGEDRRAGLFKQRVRGFQRSILPKRVIN